MFVNRILRTISYVLASAGLSLFLLSGPIPMILLAKGVSDHYRTFLKSILRYWKFEVDVLPLWLIPLSYVILTTILALVGLLAWFPPWRLLHRIQAIGNQNSPDIDQRLHSYWVIFLAGVAIIGDVLLLGLYFLIVFLSFGWGNSRAPREMHLYLLSTLLLTGLLLGHIGVALLLSRYHLRLLRG